MRQGGAHCRSVKPELQLKAKLPGSTPYGAHMDIGQYGDLNTLQWVENEFDPEPNMVHCEVIYGEQPSVLTRLDAPLYSGLCTTLRRSLSQR